MPIEKVVKIQTLWGLLWTVLQSLGKVNLLPPSGSKRPCESQSRKLKQVCPNFYGLVNCEWFMNTFKAVRKKTSHLSLRSFISAYVSTTSARQWFAKVLFGKSNARIAWALMSSMTSGFILVLSLKVRATIGVMGPSNNGYALVYKRMKYITTIFNRYDIYHILPE